MPFIMIGVGVLFGGLCLLGGGIALVLVSEWVAERVERWLPADGRMRAMWAKEDAARAAKKRREQEQLDAVLASVRAYAAVREPETWWWQDRKAQGGA